MALRFSGFSVSPWPRESKRFLPDMNPDLSPRREDAKKSIDWGFFAPLRLRERNRARLNRNPDLSRGHGGTGETDAINIDVSPRLRENIGFSVFGGFEKKTLKPPLPH